MSQLPSELVWRRSGKTTKDPQAKRRKINHDDSVVKEKLEKLEEKEGQANEDDDEEKPDDDVSVEQNCNSETIPIPFSE